MKPRTVVITLEVETDAPLKAIRNHFTYDKGAAAAIFDWDSSEYRDLVVLQCQANVIKREVKP